VTVTKMTVTVITKMTVIIRTMMKITETVTMIL